MSLVAGNNKLRSVSRDHGYKFQCFLGYSSKKCLMCEAFIGLNLYSCSASRLAIGSRRANAAFYFINDDIEGLQMFLEVSAW